MHKSKLLVALIAGLFFSLPAAAKMYKWVDDQGVTHYGETIPPEYADKDRSELNKTGRTINKKTTLSPEERRAKEEADAKKRDDAEAALESKRRDKALVNTYSSPAEIDLARKRNLQQVDARVNGIGSQVKIVNDSLLGLQKEAEGYKQAGKKLPKSLQEDMDETQVRLTKLQQDLDKTKADKAAMEARYDADKARYKELTGK
ncbi:MAG: hypothetical protein A2063_09755 [Gallionellales bacterium GWA2_60_142]|jgi:hypothetical protein|nr:MAG: hypothetical protein A2063_09755 [Gallionellales bacterium GWA2_60_142]HCI14929.1 hypothetical protein [Gallionellaceae bacterium]